VRHALDGDPDAYEVLVVRYAAPAHRLAYLVGAFVRAYRALDRYRPDAPFRPWLLRIVANETKNAVRSRKRRERLAVRALDVRAPDEPFRHAVDERRRQDLLAGVRSLAGKDREVLVWRYFLDLSEAETAVTLSLPRGTVKSRTSRALGRLRSRLGVEVTDG
jgi:RNA polymerase sigma factor (sigma-70 family)